MGGPIVGVLYLRRRSWEWDGGEMYWGRGRGRGGDVGVLVAISVTATDKRLDTWSGPRTTSVDKARCVHSGTVHPGHGPSYIQVCNFQVLNTP